MRSQANIALLVAGLAILCLAATKYKIVINFGIPKPDGLDTETSGAVAGFSGGDVTFGLTEAGFQQLIQSIAIGFNVPPEDVEIVDLTEENGNFTGEIIITSEEDLTNVNLTRIEGEFFNTTSNEVDNFNITLPEVPEIKPEPVDENNTVLIIIIVFSILGGILLGICIFMLFKHYNSKKADAVKNIPAPKDRTEEDVEMKSKEPETLDPPPLAESDKRDSIAEQRAQYRWNASANAVADPPPGGDIPLPRMSQVVDDAQQ